MISFACKEIDLKDLLLCSFSLNKTSYTVLLGILAQQDPLTPEALAKKLKLDRTTVQKALTALSARDLVTRRQHNLASGGYQYLYRVKDKGEIKKMMLDAIHAWTRQVENEINTW
jgi:predicted transcriptional regulator